MAHTIIGEYFEDIIEADIVELISNVELNEMKRKLNQLCSQQKRSVERKLNIQFSKNDPIPAISNKCLVNTRRFIKI